MLNWSTKGISFFSLIFFGFYDIVFAVANDEENKELVICVYDDNAPSINEVILEAFEKYLKSTLFKAKNL